MKKNRERLFKHSKPVIRPISLATDEGFGKDMAILWAAYKTGSFDLEEMDQKEFSEYVLNKTSGFTDGWIVEDYNPKFKESKGPIMAILGIYDGFQLEPHMEKFSWASSRNIIRATVAFLQKMRYDKNIGVINIFSLSKDKKYFDYIRKKYGVLGYVGYVPNGDPRGGKYIYYSGRHIYR